MVRPEHPLSAQALPMHALKYLAGYAPDLLAQSLPLPEQGRVLESLARRHGPVRDVRTDAALYDHVAPLKQASLDKAFIAMCIHMEPDCHPLEFDVRLWLCGLALESCENVSVAPFRMSTSCA